MSLVIDAPAGSISVPAATLLAIAVAAAERVEGVHVLRRRRIELDEPVVRLTVSAWRGEPLAEVGRAAQEQVHDALRDMCGLDARVEITIDELA